MKGELLWVYEGLTQYYGDILATRSGLRAAEQFRAYLAQSAAQLDHRPGRTWRDLEDTAVAAQVLYDSQHAWENWRRSTDFYDEGELLWLDADVTIRKLSGNKKSLDDFCAEFYGAGGNTGPALLPYTFDDLVQALNKTAPYDWARFLSERIHAKTPLAPEHGIEHGGYRIVYQSEVNDYIQASRRGGSNAWYTLGLNVGADTVISDVLFDSPAFRAGLGPGMKIVAVNGRRMSDDALRAGIRDSVNEPIELIIDNDDNFRVVSIDYHGPERYPELERIVKTPAILDDILKPRTNPPAQH
jgi:predicted metalloprotease with PDZ domain